MIAASGLYSTDKIKSIRAELNRRGRSCILDTYDKHSLEVLCNPNFEIDQLLLEKELTRRGKTCQKESKNSAQNNEFSEIFEKYKEDKLKNKYKGKPSGCKINNAKKNTLFDKLETYDFPNKNRNKHYLNDGNVYDCKWDNGTSLGFMEDYGGHWKLNGLANRKYDNGSSYFGYFEDGKYDNYGVRWYSNGQVFQGEWLENVESYGQLWYADPNNLIESLSEEIDFKGQKFNIKVRYRNTKINSESSHAIVTVEISAEKAGSYSNFINSRLKTITPKIISLRGSIGPQVNPYKITNINHALTVAAVKELKANVKLIVNEYDQDKLDRKPDSVCNLTISEKIYSDGLKTNFISKEKSKLQYIKFIDKGLLVTSNDWRDRESVDWRTGEGYNNPTESGLICESGLMLVSCSGRVFNSQDSKIIKYSKLTKELSIEIKESKAKHKKIYACDAIK